MTNIWLNWLVCDCSQSDKFQGRLRRVLIRKGHHQIVKLTIYWRGMDKVLTRQLTSFWQRHKWQVFKTEKVVQCLSKTCHIDKLLTNLRQTIDKPFRQVCDCSQSDKFQGRLRQLFFKEFFLSLSENYHIKITIDKFLTNY